MMHVTVGETNRKDYKYIATWMTDLYHGYQKYFNSLDEVAEYFSGQDVSIELIKWEFEYAGKKI